MSGPLTPQVLNSNKTSGDPGVPADREQLKQLRETVERGEAMNDTSFSTKPKAPSKIHFLKVTIP